MANQKAIRQERRATDVRQAQIVDAAIRIIASRGSRKFTAQLLGAEVGVTAGAIFRHFKTMDDIVEAIIGRIEGILFKDFPPKEADPIKRLEVFFQSRVRAIVDNPHVSRLLLSDHLAQGGHRSGETIERVQSTIPSLRSGMTASGPKVWNAQWERRP